MAAANKITWSSKVGAGDIGSFNITELVGDGTTIFAFHSTAAANVPAIAIKNTTYDFADTTIGGAVVAAADDIDNPVVTDTNTLFVRYKDVSDGNAYKLAKGTLADKAITYVAQTNKVGSANIDLQCPVANSDGSILYGVDSSSAATKFLKLSGEDTNQWDVASPDMDAGHVAGNLIFFGDNVYVVAEKGVFKYDGTTVSKLKDDIRSDNTATLRDSWGYDNTLYASDDKGNVYTYNITANTVSISLVNANKDFTTITGSQKGTYVVVAGAEGLVYKDTISEDGGGSTDSGPSAASGDTAQVVPNAPETKSAATLTSEYNTPADMTVVSEVQSFTTNGGVSKDSIHTFTYSVTPTASVAFNDLALYKLLSGTANQKYARLSAAPDTVSSGTFWIVKAADGSAVGAGDTLASGTTYTVYFTIGEGTAFDTDSSDTKITDPVVLGTSSSGSSGCVFNPSAGFGLEWFMLAFAPIAAFFRSRFKK